MKNKWFLILGVIIAAVAALASGVEFGTLLIVGVLLLCPAAMYFGMQGMGMQQSCGHEKDCDQSAGGSEREILNPDKSNRAKLRL